MKIIFINFFLFTITNSFAQSNPSFDWSVDSPRIENIESVKKDIGENKINALVRECEMRFPKYKLYDLMQPPKHEVLSNSRATLSDLADKYVTDQMLLNFSRKYGAGAELVVVMQKELRNKFNEKYFEKVHCAFTGHPKWNMITGLDFSKK